MSSRRKRQRRDHHGVARDLTGGVVKSDRTIQYERQTVAEFKAILRVAYETAAREPQVHQQVWVLEGAIEVTVGDEQYRLKFGDCLALVLDRPVTFYNPTRKVARYAVVIATLPFSAR